MMDGRAADDIKISHRKAFLPITDDINRYLVTYGRESELPVSYEDLLDFQQSYPLFDKEGQPTFWSTVVYDRIGQSGLAESLTSIYSILKTGELHAVSHLQVERVDYCEFGNSRPFRVRVVNQYNDNYDHFYIKVGDASRIYGLELEHLLSPNRMSYLVHGNTLVEEHVPGVPGDRFIKEYFSRPDLNKVRIAKEFVKFSERCFVRLLGDMRSYNYVVDLTPDFEEVQYRVRAIDFDQQSYEGRKNIYLPQFFKENHPVVQLCSTCLNYPTMKQYQEEERSLIARRYLSEQARLRALFEAMRANPHEPIEKVEQLRSELSDYHHSSAFLTCETMAEVLETHLQCSLARHLT
jgi:hypothetical protein